MQHIFRDRPGESPPEWSSQPDEGHEGSGLLSDPHCRFALEYLRQVDGEVDIHTLATHVVAKLTNTPPDSVDEATVRRVQTWLHHGHLPALADEGSVEYDPDAGEVRITRGARP